MNYGWLGCMIRECRGYDYCLYKLWIKVVAYPAYWFCRSMCNSCSWWWHSPKASSLLLLVVFVNWRLSTFISHDHGFFIFARSALCYPSLKCQSPGQYSRLVVFKLLVSKSSFNRWVFSASLVPRIFICFSRLYLTYPVTIPLTTCLFPREMSLKRI